MMKLKVCTLFFVFSIFTVLFSMSDSLATTEELSEEGSQAQDNEVIEDVSSEKENNEEQKVNDLSLQVEEDAEESVESDQTSSLAEEENKLELEDSNEEKLTDEPNVKDEEVKEEAEQQVTTFSVEQPKQLQNGTYDEDVIELKLNLAKAGFKVSDSPTDYFGPITEKVLKEFQSYYGLTDSGIAEEQTLDKLNSIINSPLQNGNRNNETIDLKHNLATLGFIVPGNMTEHFGDLTEATVKDFQKAYDLVPSGIADEVTMRKLNELIEKPLSNGMHHEDAIELKINLAKVGFKVSSNPTDYFGPLTEVAVKDFQKYYNIAVTGVADQTTLEKLADILSSPLQNGNRNNETIELKYNLATLGFVVPGNMTEHYGDLTEATVKDFQEAYGLVSSGIADEVTLRKLNELIDEPLSNGMQRKDAIDLKINLAKVGFKVSNNPTDYFGPLTEAAVKKFQKYYNIAVTGVADQTTLKKLDDIVSSPLQDGKRNKETVDLKYDLKALGFVVPGSNMTEYYGPKTKKTISEFQTYYGLKSNGIADERTLSKIEELLSSQLQNGNYNQATVQLKYDLKSLGFVVPGNMTEHYGPKTEETVKNFQKHYGLTQNGIADSSTLKKIQDLLSSPMQNGNYNSKTIELKYDLAALGFVVPGNMTEHYGPKTEKTVKSFQKAYGLPVSGIADEVTLQTIKDYVVRIFLDPGHGGTDPGADGYGIKEKDVVLDIAEKTSYYLTKNYLGVRTFLSRDSDKFISLDDRTKHANSIGADYFVSIHNNAFTGSASGFESYIYNGSTSATTKNNQKIIHNYLINKLNVNDRGMKEANFHVLRTSNMPSILIEYLFIDNKAENEKLRDSSYRQWLGQITAEAIAKAYNLKQK
ncbi:peptidoglycan-binding protein [Gracilibacillus suaedae]|uniref:peptidoglycan-binding protein n=1 Tax=Gracilibacillus suaedae TaxID=2820273 RepID=UPI001ABDD7FF|nr:peptidoglycan-binding protein [Gracilibacillus suaedae]